MWKISIQYKLFAKIFFFFYYIYRVSVSRTYLVAILRFVFVGSETHLKCMFYGPK